MFDIIISENIVWVDTKMNKNWIIKCMVEKHKWEALNFVEKSKELIEYGFEKAKEMGYEAVLVEGNPRNYNPRGFETSCDYEIIASEKIELPAPECLMTSIA